MLDKKMPEPSEMDLLKEQYRKNIIQAEERINQLDAIIPRLEKEKEQLIGMTTIMRSLFESKPEEGIDESKSNGSKSDSNP